jgi:hypothetical protein
VVVGFAEVADDFVEAGAAFEVELDLDGDPVFLAREDRVGQVGAGLMAGVEALRDSAFAFPASEPVVAFQQEPDVGDRFDVGGEPLVWLPGAEGRLGDLAAAAGEPDEGR